MFSGTTAVIVLIWNNIAICANAGDSRALMAS
jgi:serine/threonine protein phosphatase PrpC